VKPLSVNKLHKEFSSKYLFDKKEADHIYEHCDCNTYQSRILNRRLKLNKFQSSLDKYEDRVAIIKYNKIVRKYKAKRGFWVWSGIKFHPAKYQKVPNKPFRVPILTFMSTSLDRIIASDFAGTILSDVEPKIKVWNSNSEICTAEELAEYEAWKQSKCYWLDHFRLGFPVDCAHMLHIFIPRSAHGAYVAKYAGTFKTEKEFILPLGASLEVSPEYEIDRKERRVIWTARLVHDGVKSLHPKYRRH
jgi:hypothetical protein